MQYLLRLLIGGSVVCLFAALGDVLKPKSFAGLFSAAPSVALASLALTYQSKGARYVSTEATSMIAGAIAFAVYAWTVWRVLRHGQHPVHIVALVLLVVWFVV